MFYPGLVSVSFRSLSPEEIVQAMANCGLQYVEWGSDIHAPCTDVERLDQIVALQKKHGITCCSYGTYFRLGVTPMEELPAYIRAAKRLGTNTLRLWAGKKDSQKITPQERDEFFAQCCQAAKIAEDAGVTLCMECHNGTYTQTKDGALELMKHVNSSAFRMYWQPNLSIEENVEYIRLLKPYIDHVHVYYWDAQTKCPLQKGENHWKTYLAELGGDRPLLLEFMHDNRVESLPAEAETLRSFIAACEM